MSAGNNLVMFPSGDDKWSQLSRAVDEVDPQTQTLEPVQVRTNGQEPKPARRAAHPSTSLLDDIEKLIRRFIVLPQQEDFTTVVLWVAHTHAIEVFNHTPRLFASAPEEGCGKSTLLKVIEGLTQDATRSSLATTASLFRWIEDHDVPPVILLDERDQSYMDTEFIALMNDGFERGGAVLRAEHSVKGGYKTRKFKAFCPIAMAGIDLRNQLPNMLLSRGIVIRMRPLGDLDVEDWVPGFNEFAKMNERLSRWQKLGREGLASHSPNLPDGIKGHAKDAWKPLFVIAEQVGGEWPDRATKAFHTLSKQDTTPSQGLVLLTDIRDYFQQQEIDRFHTVDLLFELNSMEERDYAAWNNGEGIKSQDIGYFAERYEVRRSGSGNVRMLDGSKKGWYLKDWLPAFETYLSVAVA